MLDPSSISWLALKAANGLNIPYVGYAVMDFRVGGIEVKGKGVVIVRDDCINTEYGLLGMNVIEDCWAGIFRGGHPGVAAFKSVFPPAAEKAWDAAFAACQRINASMPNMDLQGVARLPRQPPVVVPPSTEMIIWAHVPQAASQPDCPVLIEDLENHGQEWRVARSVSWTRKGMVPMRVCNPNPFPLELRQRCPLASVTQIDPQDIQGQSRLVLRSTGPRVVEVDIQQVGQTPEEDHPALSLSGEGLNDHQQAQLKSLLQKWYHVFAANDEDFGQTAVVTHQIPTGVAPPIRERYRPVPPKLYTELRALLQGMLDSGVVKESASPWAAPVVLAKKKDGSLRFCVDYRKLNAVTHKDSFPLPRIEESLTSLSKSEWYSTLDLASGYWQVEVAPEDQEKTAFATPFGLYQFERMPFGLCNAPATFQRLMQRCLGAQVHDYLLIYLDDVIVYSPSFQSHLNHLEQVFARLHNYGLKLQPRKCRLFQRHVAYLGHIVSKEGVATDPDKTRVVRDWAVPSTVKQVRSFLGFAGYYRRFIPAFAKVAAPLHELLQGQANRPSARIQWTSDCQSAFDHLKQALLAAPILAYADFQLPFRVYTDASLHGLGAVLAQVQDGKERVIAYASRSLHASERNDQNYSSFKLELLALKWAVTEKFKDYLWGAQFTVFTDNNPLVHLDTATLGATEQRWVAQLANFSYDIRYRPGATNRNADVLSRLPGEATNLLVHVAGCSTTSEQQGAPEGWSERQAEDPDLRRLRALKASKEPPPRSDCPSLSPEFRCLLREWDRLELQDGVLVRCVAEPDTGAPVDQVLVPVQQARRLWEDYHKAGGHASGDKMVSLLRRRFYWPGMSTHARKWAAECSTCVVQKLGAQPKAPLCPISSSYPFETVALDFLSLGRPSDTYQYILVITDLFSRYALAVPTKDQSAPTTIRALYTALILPFGCPERILTDQGASFEALLMQQLCAVYGCKKVRTTPYHPQGNGACERFNRTLLSLLGTIDVNSQNQWPSLLPALLQAYNNTTHASTGMTPHYVIFGRHARLPVDMLHDAAPPQHRDDLEGWVRSHHQTLLQAYTTVRNNVERRMQWNQDRYDRNARTMPLLPGERVLMRNFRRRAQGKLAPQWLPTPFVIVTTPYRGRPVFTIRPEGKEGPLRTIHRNNLRACPTDAPAPQNGRQDKLPMLSGPRIPFVTCPPTPPMRPVPTVTLPGSAQEPPNAAVCPLPSLASTSLPHEAPGPRPQSAIVTGEQTVHPPVASTHDPVPPPGALAHDPASSQHDTDPTNTRRYPIRPNRGNPPARCTGPHRSRHPGVGWPFYSVETSAFPGLVASLGPCARAEDVGFNCLVP
ncbi:hypothetical protein ACEWY4_010910 [Coilia grayii]|uniref:Gypsy retrotransposon integrase-like protein 1 n=1 Tax=Coilia grayii TaxID=363190 RepID=A0ABD1K3A9_9TELE